MLATTGGQALLPAAAVTTAPVADKTSVAVEKLSVECQRVDSESLKAFLCSYPEARMAVHSKVSELFGAFTLSEICLLKYLGYLPRELTLGRNNSYWLISWYIW